MIYVLIEGGTSEYGDCIEVNQFIFASKDKVLVEKKMQELQKEVDKINLMNNDFFQRRRVYENSVAPLKLYSEMDLIREVLQEDGLTYNLNDVEVVRQKRAKEFNEANKLQDIENDNFNIELQKYMQETYGTPNPKFNGFENYYIQEVESD